MDKAEADNFLLYFDEEGSSSGEDLFSKGEEATVSKKPVPPASASVSVEVEGALWRPKPQKTKKMAANRKKAQRKHSIEVSESPSGSLEEQLSRLPGHNKENSKESAASLILSSSRTSCDSGASPKAPVANWKDLWMHREPSIPLSSASMGSFRSLEHASMSSLPVDDAMEGSSSSELHFTPAMGPIEPAILDSLSMSDEDDIVELSHITDTSPSRESTAYKASSHAPVPNGGDSSHDEIVEPSDIDFAASEESEDSPLFISPGQTTFRKRRGRGSSSSEEIGAQTAPIPSRIRRAGSSARSW